MAYKALYRSYRPQDFSEVVDQKAIVKTLMNAIENNRVGHAYLFSGPRGTGKTSLAKIFAKSLNCSQGPTTKPCGKCEICEGIQKGTLPDVIEIDAASNNGADDIRQIRDSVKFMPSKARYKVYIIDEVHMLSNAAFNALLKTLEEPPAYVIFILATTEPYKLPNTILSRCQRFDFKAISEAGINSQIAKIANLEGIKLTTEAAQAIANISEGGMRDALSLLDQVNAYHTGEEITLDDVFAVSGNTPLLALKELLFEVSNNESVKAINKLNEILSSGKEVPKLTSDLMFFLRDILMLKNGIKIENKTFYYEEQNLNFFNSINNLALYKWLDILNEASNEMRYATQKKNYLELAILKMSDALNNEENILLKRLNDLELRLKKLEQNDTSTNLEIKTTKAKELVELNNNIKEIKQEIKQPISGDFITVAELNAVLNSGEKQLKEMYKNKLPNLRFRYADLIAFGIFCNGNIVCASKTSLIVTLADVGFCHRVMNNISYYKILEILQSVNPELASFYAIPNSLWAKMSKEFKEKFEAGDKQPILSEQLIEIERPKPIYNEINTEFEVEDKLKEIFGDQLEIKED